MKQKDAFLHFLTSCLIYSLPLLECPLVSDVTVSRDSYIVIRKNIAGMYSGCGTGANVWETAGLVTKWFAIT